MCTGNENSEPIWNKFIIRKDIIETSQVVLDFCRIVYIICKKEIYNAFLFCVLQIDFYSNDLVYWLKISHTNVIQDTEQRFEENSHMR